MGERYKGIAPGFILGMSSVQRLPFVIEVVERPTHVPLRLKRHVV
jgi:hypothetical protein